MHSLAAFWNTMFGTTGDRVTTLESGMSSCVTVLDGKANTVHGHVVNDTTGLQAAIDAKLASGAVSAYALTMLDDPDAATARGTLGLGTAATSASSAFSTTSHNHATADTSSGTFADGRIAQSNVTQHQAALIIDSNQITGTKTSSYISDFTEAAQDAIGGVLSAEFIYNDGANTIGLRALSFTNNASHSIVTVAAAANGFQLSSTRNTSVNYSVTVTTAVQIGVATNISGYVVLEIAATNSSTAGDWQEIGRFGGGQNISLALALASTQTASGQISGNVPAGYYARLRSVNANGTPTYAYNSGQEILL